ncbi:MAG: MEthanogen/methylotroph, DcmR Sensory domain [Deltaproteobacteria bacterium]|nr:MEthanogen/methylotroph, DcmR Sensory domain [Deltaproteobacteria bacterium]
MAPNHEVPIGFTGETFPPGTHMCYIYHDEDERQRIIYQFLESGLQNGENVSYFMDINTADEMREYQAALGVDKLYKEQRGHFSLATTMEAYCPNGIFIPDEMLDRLSEFYTQSINEGYTGARSTGEMSWATRGVPGSSRFMEYEARLNSTLNRCPVTTMCQYHANLFDNAALRDVLTVHPLIVLHGRIVKNPYYIKFWWLLKKYLGLKTGAGP